MGGSAGENASGNARKVRRSQFHFTTTQGHLKLIDQLIQSGVVASRSEALRCAFYQAKYANTSLFKELVPQRKAS